MSIFLIRNGQRASYEPEYFWFLAQSHQLFRSDLIFDWQSSHFLPAYQFADVEPYLPPKTLGEILEDFASAALGVAVVFVGVVAAIQVCDSIFGPTENARPSRRRKPNYEPLEGWKKQVVRERDEEICDYCGIHDSTGHVDHKTSRANGGSNQLRNLVWACVSCNCSKGRMNARTFRRFWMN
jgi:HNH endonuclease